MSTIKNPTEKKRVAYERDHYNRNGESNKAWRKAKPLKKAKANRAFRKAANDLTRICATDDGILTAATRKKEGLQKRRVTDWGSLSLREFVASRAERRQDTIGARKIRQAKAYSAGNA